MSFPLQELPCSNLLTPLLTHKANKSSYFPGPALLKPSVRGSAKCPTLAKGSLQRALLLLPHQALATGLQASRCCAQPLCKHSSRASHTMQAPTSSALARQAAQSAWPLQQPWPCHRHTPVLEQWYASPLRLPAADLDALMPQVLSRSSEA